MTYYDYIQLGIGILWIIAILCVVGYFYYVHIVIDGRVRFNNKTYQKFLKKRVKSWSLYGKDEEGTLIYTYPFGWLEMGKFALQYKEVFYIKWIMESKNDVDKLRYARNLRACGYKLVINYYDKDLDN